MAEYQHLFTRVVVDAPTDPGVDLGRDGNMSRPQKTIHSRLAGKIGDAQIGPLYLGW